MKRMITILISGFMVLGLTACGSQTAQTGQGVREEAPVENAESEAVERDAETNDMAQSSTDSAVEAEESTAENISGADADIQDDANVQNDTDVQEVKVLVAYFSATNTTKGVAQHIADGLNADIYEIVPEEPYTDADLNYHDNNSRTTIEMNDPSFRPAISGSVEDMEQYDIIFLGYPIWWSEAPRILSTFVESYDFSGKTIVPFCTSGGSGVGSSATNLEQLTSGANWLAGKRLSGSDSQDMVMEWVNSLGSDV
ncbi:MAG: flavodoxin [Clostridium sp.]|nr:flavodoxin [Clostridium sp.]